MTENTSMQSVWREVVKTINTPSQKQKRIEFLKNEYNYNYDKFLQFLGQIRQMYMEQGQCESSPDSQAIDSAKILKLKNLQLMLNFYSSQADKIRDEIFKLNQELKS